MNYKWMLSLLLVAGLAGYALAKAPLTIQIASQEPGAKIMVNGVEYVPGTPIKSGDKISVTGTATLVIGGAVLKTGGATFTLQGGNVRVTSGTVQATNAQGKTTVLGQGDKVSTKAPPPPAAVVQAAVAAPLIQAPPIPPPNPKQDEKIAPPVSGSTP